MEEQPNTSSNKDDQTTQNENIENNETDQQEEDENLTLYIKTPNNNQLEVQLTSSESVQDIRQFLLEVPETCFMTCYHLELDGKTLNDFSDISEIEEIKNQSVLYMVEDEYTEHKARIHLNRVRELLSLSGRDNDSIALEFKNVEGSSFEGVKKTDHGDEPVLTEFYPQTNTEINCIKRIIYSGWNPPPPQRKLHGDFFYLDVDTLEEEPLTITAWPKGFFVNQCKGKFSPQMRDKKHSAHNLVDLLKIVSPKFIDSFNFLVNKYVNPSAVETLPGQLPFTSWIAKPLLHEYNNNRSESSLLESNSVEFNINGHSREWNDEFQACKDLPSENALDRMNRDRSLFRVYCEFSEAAVKGGVEIINGNVPPINPLDEKKAHMFIYNNIFYSFAMDGREYYKDIGGDSAAYKSASNDLLGVQLYNRADINGLYTLATIIIDYKGYRIVGQSIIPGLFTERNNPEDNEMKLAYGSLDQKTISVNSDFHSLMVQSAKKLNIKVHEVQDDENKNTTIASHFEIKGIVGTDNRKYILDLTYPTPRDANFSELENSTAILRPELISLYLLHLREKEKMARYREKAEKQKQQKVEAGETKVDETKTDEEKNQENTQTDQEKAPEDTQETNEDDEIEKIPLPEIYYNTDLFKKVKVVGDEKELEEDKKRIEELSSFLLELIIPKFVLENQLNFNNSVDSDTLKVNFHRLGINMRYLGTVAKLAENKAQNLWELCVADMVTRTFKFIFNESIRESSSTNLVNTVTHLLNTFFGRYSNSNEGSRSGFISQDDISSVTSGSKSNKKHKKVFNMNHNDLWSLIREKVLAKYKFELPELIPITLFQVQTLRTVCKRCGIQLRSRDFDLNREKPFTLDDVVNLFPVVKYSIPKSSDGQSLFETGRELLAQRRHDIAFELLTEALTVYHQVYGPMFQDTALCYSVMAKMLYDIGDYAQAIDHQEKSVIIYERTLGLDHYDTFQAYYNLAIFKLENSENEGTYIINLMKRALFLSYLIGGPKNPEATSVLLNLGTILQYQGRFDEAIKNYSFALDNTVNIYGPNHLETANMYHTIAYAYSLAQNFNEALKMEQKNYEILRVTVGEKDLRTIESNVWLKQLTKSALSEVKKNIQTNKRNVPKKNQKVTNTEGQIRGMTGVTRGNKGRGGRVIRVVKKSNTGNPNIEEVTENGGKTNTPTDNTRGGRGGKRGGRGKKL